MDIRQFLSNYHRFEQNKPSRNADVFNLLTNPLIEKLLCSPTRGYAIIDSINWKYAYLSSNLGQVLGWPIENYIKNGPSFVLDNMTSSRTYVEKAMKVAIDHVASKELPNDSTSVVFTYLFQVLMASGEQQWFYQEVIPIPWEGKLDLSHQLALVSKATEPPAPNEPYFTLYDFDKENSFVRWSTFDRPDDLQDLTTREVQVLKLLVTGGSAKKIGEQLFIAENTVISHRRKIITKCGCRNLNELIRFVTKSGMV